jgi:hypothetical protein
MLLRASRQGLRRYQNHTFVRSQVSLLSLRKDEDAEDDRRIPVASSSSLGAFESPLVHRQFQKRDYHNTVRSEILPLVGAVVVGGLGYVVYKKLRGETVKPEEAKQAQETFRREETQRQGLSSPPQKKEANTPKTEATKED